MTSSQTLDFFAVLGLSCDFLTTADPVEWEAMEEFQLAKKVVTSLRVVNDTAERGVKLIQDFNSSITRCEEQKQFLLQVVSQHRSKFPEPKKSLLVVKHAAEPVDDSSDGNE